MTFLRPFFAENSTDIPNALLHSAMMDHFRKVSVQMGKTSMADLVAYSYYMPEELLEIYDDENTIIDETHRATSPNDMLEKLGLYGLHEIKLKNNEIFIHVSSDYPIGLGVKKISCGFAHAIVYEIGTDNCHVRIDVRDKWDGSYFPTQIDSMTIWNRNRVLNIPVSMPSTYEKVEDVLGIVDTTTQALLNGDDMYAMQDFSAIDEIVEEFLPILNKRYIKTLQVP